MSRSPSLRRAAAATLALALAGCAGGSNPAELARERGAVERVREVACASGGTLGAVVGGDLKTDWSARRSGDGYAVTMGAHTFVAPAGDGAVAATTPAARDALARCRPSPP